MFTYKIKEIVKLLSKKNKLEAISHKYNRKGKDEKMKKIQEKIKKIEEKLLPIKNMFELGHEK